MEEGKLDAQFLAAFIWQGKRDDVSSQKAVESTTLLIQSIYDEVAKYKDFLWHRPYGKGFGTFKRMKARKLSL